MADKITCPKCNEINELHNYCVYCGEYLLSDDEIKLMKENPDPYCLNCGRPVTYGQHECECGNEFEDIHCPICNSTNEYSNKFCVSCGNKLWTSEIYNEYKYSENLFKNNISPKKLPHQLENTLIYYRVKNRIGANPKINDTTLKNLKKEELKVNDNLIEIGSRWKIISKNYCIHCLNLIKASQNKCSKCKYKFADKNRVEFIKTHNYIKPKFKNADLKWTSKNSENYLSSLSPAFGESQFEYRERLKWEFSENMYLKKLIKPKIKVMKSELELRRKEEIELKRQEEKRRQEAEKRLLEAEYIRLYGGGYCSSSCRHYYYRRDYLDENFCLTADNITGYYEDHKYCDLGHSLHSGHFCKDYKK